MLHTSNPMHKNTLQTQSFLQIVKTIKRTNRFSSRYFDFQVAYKYLLRLLDNNLIETTAYQHYLNGVPTDLAIDISTMVGCPVGCRFCASATQVHVHTLTVEEIIAQVTTIINGHNFQEFPKIVCSFQGIGEPSLLPDEIVEASKSLIEIDSRIVISLSTTGIALDAFRIWRESDIFFDNLQISCCGTTTQQTKKLIPNSPSLRGLLVEAVKCIESNRFDKVKINYILIKNINDSEEDIQRLISFVKGLPITVKISSLNPTIASEQYGLNPSSFEHESKICSALQANGIDSYVYGSLSKTNVSCGQLAFLGGRNEKE
jgi:23S rRNA (adenine2503-C2)-methyltransferase